MVEQIKYINHLNEVIEFGSEIYANYNDLRDYAWQYDTDNDLISNLRRGIASKSLPLFIFGYTEESAIKLKNRLFEVLEKDILANIKGTLWINGYYYKCFIVEGQTSDYLTDKRYLQKQVTIISDYPAWIKETESTFTIQDVISSDNKRYAGKYAYRYANGLTDKTIHNEHFASSNMQITFYGPVLNPLVIIGENTYKVNTILNEGEYLTIDTADKTITKVQNNGSRVNMFNERDKEHNVFKKIASGVQPISWSGDFMFSIKVFEERSEPKWTL